jgi:hypothetical protein
MSSDKAAGIVKIGNAVPGVPVTVPDRILRTTEYKGNNNNNLTLSLSLSGDSGDSGDTYL